MKTPFLLLSAVAMFVTGVRAADWVNISDVFTATVKPGYGGPTAGVTVDRVDGTVYVIVSDQGLWRSTDKAATFSRCDGGAIGGRGETGWTLQPDPAGRRMACFVVYGDSALTTDGGLTWTKFKTSHLDYGSVDWEDTGKRLLAVRHESGGMLTTSADGGATWQDLGKGFSGCGVLNQTTFVATKEKEPGIFRSTDSGATWTRVLEETPSAAVPVTFKGVTYWATGKRLIMSSDKGATWQPAGTPVEAAYGPFFDTATHFVVAGKGGFFETTDGGTTWKQAAPLPPGFGVTRTGPNYAWDPKADVFYASTMMKAAFKYARK